MFHVRAVVICPWALVHCSVVLWAGCRILHPLRRWIARRLSRHTWEGVSLPLGKEFALKSGPGILPVGRGLVSSGRLPLDVSIPTQWKKEGRPRPSSFRPRGDLAQERGDPKMDSRSLAFVQSRYLVLREKERGMRRGVVVRCLAPAGGGG